MNLRRSPDPIVGWGRGKPEPPPDLYTSLARFIVLFISPSALNISVCRLLCCYAHMGLVSHQLYRHLFDRYYPCVSKSWVASNQYIRTRISLLAFLQPQVDFDHVNVNVKII